MEHFPVYYSILVHHIYLSWNQIEASILIMYEKLVQLDFTYCVDEDY